MRDAQVLLHESPHHLPYGLTRHTARIHKPTGHLLDAASSAAVEVADADRVALALRLSQRAVALNGDLGIGGKPTGVVV